VRAGRAKRSINFGKKEGEKFSTQGADDEIELNPQMNFDSSRR
jgi:hypothetical protein